MSVAVSPDWRSRTTITVEEAAPILGVGRSAAYAAVRDGEIPAIRVGRRLIVPVGRLRQLLGEIEPATNDDTPAANGRVGKLGDGDARNTV